MWRSHLSKEYVWWIVRVGLDFLGLAGGHCLTCTICWFSVGIDPRESSSSASFDVNISFSPGTTSDAIAPAVLVW